MPVSEIASLLALKVSIPAVPNRDRFVFDDKVIDCPAPVSLAIPLPIGVPEAFFPQRSG